MEHRFQRAQGSAAVMSASQQVVRVVHPVPNIAKGVEYWQGVPATVDGVLGGYGLGTLPRVDSLGSRQFLLKHLKRLGNIAPASADPAAWMEEKVRWRGGESSKGRAVTRALDCGAGVGRVTETVLLPLVDEVHLVEPVVKFLLEAKKRSSTWKPMKLHPEQQPFNACKVVHFHEATLQLFDPRNPYAPPSAKATGKRKAHPDGPQTPNESALVAGIEPAITPTVSIAGDVGEDRSSGEAGAVLDEVEYDVVWIQWCLQHLSDSDLLSFLKRCKQSLKPAKDSAKVPNGSTQPEWAESERTGGMIFVKENVCGENEDGSERSIWDNEDHSITRSTNAYERVFREAGLDIADCQVQHGLPDELFVVKMWALR
ncbi:DUF858-domain-containing protein [Tilletiaria anomala UBC 951]|uniref:Alpha N-terminal protein methyltransferase 1 n=1 Tax=Tilletiaria anomala (strain ATCC 24038 / CBS 436.72 / UBC 951) TaxID=1037660 RepID=A0A066WCS4_TILAU|nr:DUF858-domain-containing protein [Tilletiaria anomala UBC 951]KDN48849.1 DUF858-domain-containing protein [Tilletiaria anomala UBC 951]